MSNIKLNLSAEPFSGQIVTFTAPCDCVDVEDGLIINDEIYTVVDAMGKVLTGKGGAWCEGAKVSVVLDCENKNAYIQGGGSGGSGGNGISTGAYTGRGTNSVTIETGFRPKVVMMRTKDIWCDTGTKYGQSMTVEYGWVLWTGEDSITLPTTPDAASNSGITAAKTINFTVTDTSLSWSVDNTDGDTASAIRAANNSMNTTYQWIAIGEEASITAVPLSGGGDGVGIDDIVRTDGDGSAGSTDTYTIYLSDGSTKTFTVYNGKDGITPHIGDNGNWWIGDTDTGVHAIGTAGADGKDGVDGKDGANGVDGKDGADGKDGKSAYEYAKDGGYTGTEAEFMAKMAMNAAPAYTYGTANIEAGSASSAPNGSLHFVYE